MSSEHVAGKAVRFQNLDSVGIGERRRMKTKGSVWTSYDVFLCISFTLTRDSFISEGKVELFPA